MDPREQPPLVVTPAEIFLTFLMTFVGAGTLTIILVGGLWLVERIFTK